MIRVVVVDDDDVIRRSLRIIIDAEADMVVVGEAATGDRGVDTVLRLRPDVAIVDINMPESSGIEATERIHVRLTELGDLNARPTAILVLTAMGDDETTTAALRAGARGYLLKGLERRELTSAIRAVARGEAVLASPVTAHVIGSALRTAGPPRRTLDVVGSLTERETELLRAIGLGLSNAEIADLMILAPNSVKTYISRVLEKTGMANRTQLAILAYRSGVLDDADFD